MLPILLYDQLSCPYLYSYSPSYSLLTMLLSLVWQLHVFSQPSHRFRSTSRFYRMCISPSLLLFHWPPLIERQRHNSPSLTLYHSSSLMPHSLWTTHNRVSSHASYHLPSSVYHFLFRFQWCYRASDRFFCLVIRNWSSSISHYCHDS